MPKQTKEPALFDDEILELLKVNGLYIARPICKHCMISVIDVVTEKYPGVSINANYINDGLYNLVIVLNEK